MSVLALLSVVLPAVSVALAVAYLLDVPQAACTTLGARGLARQRARESLVFRIMEPLLRLMASHLEPLPLARHRAKVEGSIVGAGEFHGLGPDELLALSGLSGLAGCGAGYYFWSVSGGIVVPLACCIIGPLLPFMQLSSLAKERHKSVDRGLPAAIDLAALCMSAGLDFPGSIRHVVDNMPNRTSPMRQELERLLQELSLGRTRKEVLESLSERVDTDSVNEFVAAVVQAEEKGTALSTVLSVQATALRGRRSVLAEEAAARAGVMLMLPMLMMMGSITLILMGPLIIDMMKGGLM
ncbi:MAG: hypothetical protein GY811_15985 [Myxococcales bacterium]|nr:hypothetical protein [Myxococcales bacterium]